MIRQLGIALWLLAHAAQADTPPLPLTIAERIAACVAAEDGEPARAIALADSVLAEGATLTAVQQAEALGCRGWSHAMLTQREEARRDAYAVVALLQTMQPSADRVRLTRRAGGILHRGGDRVGAVELYARAVAEAEAHGLEAERIPLLVNLGVLHSEFEEHERARVNYEQALGLMDRLDDHRYEAPVRFNLGLTLNGQDKFAEAIPHLQRTLELVRSSGMGGPNQEIAITLALAQALQQTGDNSAADQLIAQVRAMAVPLSDPSLRLSMLQLEVDQRAKAGDPQGALRLLDSVDIAEADPLQRWYWLRNRVGVLETLGRFEEAARGLREINTLRETYLRHQNHERLAALEAHLRDREQRIEMDRMQAAAAVREHQLAVSLRQTWMIAIAAGLLLLMGGVVVAVQRRMNRRLDQVSRTDPLTGLANRRDMAERLSRQVSSGESNAAVFLFDIDLFKRINDEHGHAVGDEVLVAIAGRLRDCLPADGRVARWGGEEFLVLLRATDSVAAQALVERVRDAMREPVRTVAGQIQLSLSAGFCNLPLPGASGPQAWNCSVQLADSALYLAKRAQRNTWVGYWLTHTIADWPPERLGREPALARSVGVLVATSERPLAPVLAMVS